MNIYYSKIYQQRSSEHVHKYEYDQLFFRNFSKIYKFFLHRCSFIFILLPKLCIMLPCYHPIILLLVYHYFNGFCRSNMVNEWNRLYVCFLQEASFSIRYRISCWWVILITHHQKCPKTCLEWHVYIDIQESIWLPLTSKVKWSKYHVLSLWYTFFHCYVKVLYMMYFEE